MPRCRDPHDRPFLSLALAGGADFLVSGVDDLLVLAPRRALLMIYVDTSALVPVFIRESKSEAVINWLESSGERLAISEWSLVEFAAAVAIKVRTGQVAASLAKQATARVHEFARKYCAVAIPGREEFRRAAELAGRGTLKLKAGDALHLAIAASLGGLAILCLDDAMIESAKALGMTVVTV